MQYASQAYGDLAELNTCRLLLDAVGQDVLRDLVQDYLDLLHTSTAVYEQNGDYALGIFTSGWCRFMDDASRRVCHTADNREALRCGKWHCHECCWRGASQKAIETRSAVDVECAGGIRLYALPILAGEEVVGSINFGYGDPPRDPRKLAELAQRYQVDVDQLRQYAAAYESRPAQVIETAKRRLAATARLIGEIVRRQQANNLLDAVLNNTHMLVACLDCDFNFILVNRAYAQADERTAEFYLGKNHFALFPNQENEAIFRRVVETGEPCFYYGKPFGYHEHPERGVSYWDWSLAPVKDTAGRVVLLVFTLLDVTHAKRAEDALREADRRKDEFLATLAHELRNPLAPIRNSLQLIKLQAESPADVAHARGIAERQLDQLVRLVDDLLDLSRITRGKIELRTERVELTRIIHSAVETSRPHIDAGGHQLTLALPPQPVYLEADLMRLAQAVANLLINAAKYTEPGGQIRLGARQEGDHVLIEVADNGIGIRAEMLPHIFDMFSQADRPPERCQGGLGIGLTLVKQLVEMHGGSVCVASRGTGQGSAFTLRLPLAADVHGAAEESSSLAAGQPPPSPSLRRLLVVDDYSEGADTLADILRLLGHDVRTAYDGQQAIEIAHLFRPDAVLLDIGMPGMSGCTVAEHLRQQPESRDTLLIALTGWGQEEDRRRCREAGFHHHLVKPVDVESLQALLNTLPQSTAT